MKPEQINVAIAHECGYKSNPITGLWFEPWWFGPDKQSGGLTYPPDYYRDLNAIQTAVDTLSWETRVTFMYKLGEVLGFRNRNDWIVVDMINATAAQRCEAFLKTLGRWTEGRPSDTQSKALK